MVELLLTSGADPIIGGRDQGFFQDRLKLSEFLPGTRTKELEVLRMSLRSRQPEQQLLAVNEKIFSPVPREGLVNYTSKP